MASDPLVLGFDTSAAHCAAALLCGDRVVATRTEDMARGQAERLMVLLEEILAEARAEWRDLDTIGVGIGPGNFTGIRISVSAARGLALALKIPAIGVSTFQALAFGQQGTSVAAVKGPADKTYVQVMTGRAVSKPMICGPDELPDYPAKAEPCLLAFPSAEALKPSGASAAGCSMLRACPRPLPGSRRPGVSTSPTNRPRRFTSSPQTPHLRAIRPR